MNDQNNNSNPSQLTPDPVNSAPVAPPQAPDPVAAAPAADPNKDLQALSQDLENLAKEAVETTPATAPVVPVATAPEPVVVPPVAEPVVEPTQAPEVAVPVIEEKADASNNTQVTIYTTANCPFCKAEKEYLASLNLNYVEKNVEEDTESLKEMLNLSDNFAGVPVTVLNGPKGKKVVKGFTQDEFVKELEETGLKEASVSEAPAVVAPVIEAPMPAVPVVSEAQPTVAPEAPATQAPSETPTVPDLN